MATTLLQGVNKVFKQVGLISAGSPELTSLTDSPRQVDIDLCVQLWNDAIEYMQGFADLPGDVGAGTITLVTDTREYDLAADFQSFVGDSRGDVYMTCASPQYMIVQYPGGYKEMFVDQPDPAQFTGQPGYFALNPVTTKIRLDRTPTAAENGQTLSYLYDKTLTLAAATDNFPIPDAAVNVMTSTVSEAFMMKRKGQFNNGVWRLNLAEAIRIASKRAKDNAYA